MEQQEELIESHHHENEVKNWCSWSFLQVNYVDMLSQFTECPRAWETSTQVIVKF